MLLQRRELWDLYKHLLAQGALRSCWIAEGRAVSEPKYNMPVDYPSRTGYCEWRIHDLMALVYHLTSVRIGKSADRRASAKV